jgi:glucose-1-phosphate adenylyltransferase
MHDVLSLILGGGRGTRLYPLTKMRSKPAVPIAGKYRLIDLPISNCINSELHRVYVLTQFLSVSLHRHIANTYKFDPFGGGFVEVLAAQQTNEAADWYQGTADAVRQQVRYVQEDGADEVLVLSGDQLYRMDFRDLVRTHRECRADVTIAVLPRSPALGFCGSTTGVGWSASWRNRKPTPSSSRCGCRSDSATGFRTPTALTWPAWEFICSSAMC